MVIVPNKMRSKPGMVARERTQAMGDCDSTLVCSVDAGDQFQAFLDIGDARTVGFMQSKNNKEGINRVICEIQGWRVYYDGHR